MDDNYLHIRWETGYMTIVLDAFFPCSMEKLKKLLKVVELDWEHRNDLIEKLKVHFQERKAECETLHQDYGKQYFDAKQRTADLTRLVENRKHPNGLPLKRDEWEQANKDLKRSKADVTNYLTRAKAYKRNIERFERHIELVS